MPRKFNFGAGPATMPESVLKEGTFVISSTPKKIDRTNTNIKSMICVSIFNYYFTDSLTILP